MPGFEALDTSGDGRLSLREIRTAPQRLATFDKDEDGKVQPSLPDLSGDGPSIVYDVVGARSPDVGVDAAEQAPGFAVAPLFDHRLGGVEGPLGWSVALVATEEEVREMQALVRQGMEDGAWGIGAGPEYRPGRFSTTEEIIAEQGDFLSNLFFVNSGRVQLYTSNNGKDTPFKTVEEGEIFGADSFFDISVWTYNAKSLGANLSVLTWKRLASLNKDYPALQSNLLEYCSRFRTDSAYFGKPSTSRRKYERKKLAGRATMELLSMTGDETGQVARGDLLDISQGGVAFVLRFHRKEYATDLLGKHVKVIIRPDNSITPLKKSGMVKAVRSHDSAGNDYSVHLEFDELLGATEVSQAAATSSR